MATNENYECQTFLAGADLSATSNQFKFVELNGTANTVTVANAATDILIGVLMSLDVSGQPVAVAVSGRVKVVAGAALATPGTSVTTDSSGRAVAAVSTNRVRGFTLTTAAGAGELVEVLLVGANQILA